MDAAERNPVAACLGIPYCILSIADPRGSRCLEIVAGAGNARHLLDWDYRIDLRVGLCTAWPPTAFSNWGQCLSRCVRQRRLVEGNRSAAVRFCPLAGDWDDLAGCN